MTSGGRTVFPNEITMARIKPPNTPSISAPPPRLEVQATAPTATNTANKIPVRVMTSSIVIRPVRIEDAAGALNVRSS
ncbi:unannotated protein [freshwater metagenome]|uniref:Unannotated protein n=1 Tax=freshwater metagenome TaxID=449393 RepID=A0A6J6MHK8_9ZZZZ